MVIFSNIPRDVLKQFATVHLLAELEFGDNLSEASARKQRNIRKWMCNRTIGYISDMPAECHAVLRDHSDKDVLQFFKDCRDADEALMQADQAKFEQEFAALDAPTRHALNHLRTIDMWPDMQLNGCDARIVIDESPAYRQVLTLHNIGGVPQNTQYCWCENSGVVFDQDQNRFCFYGEMLDQEGDVSTPFSLTFESTSVKTEVYNACAGMTFWDNPWDLLRTICFGIGLKADIPGDYCNEQEKALLPLIREIVSLEYWMELAEQKQVSFSGLKAKTKQYGYVKAERLLSKLETLKPGSDAYDKTVKALLTVLCEKSYEPLWREIFNTLVDSQAAYPNKTETLCDPDLLMRVRGDIQARMEAKGYSGTYPDFVKYGALKGIHLERSYDMTYFVGMEKRAVYHVHCAESFQENDCLIVQFLCGTAFLKTNEADEDVYGCLFRANGRRLFRMMHHTVPLQPDDENREDNLDTSVSIAVKKAECTKLTKAEREAYHGWYTPGFAAFLGIFIIAGGMFAVAMTAIMTVVCALVTAAFGLASEIPDMLQTIPWGWVLAIGCIGFGGAFGITEILALRK